MLIAAALTLSIRSLVQEGWPLTKAETSHFQATSTYDDVIEFIGKLQQRGAPINLEWSGVSEKGHKIPMVVCADPMVDPLQAKRSGKLIVYIQGNIHGGEVEGKEAAQIILRRLSADRKLLDKMIFVINPIYNIDGNESWGPVAKNRPEQDGPPIVGQRANGAGLDLNRDCVKVKSPEMRGALTNIYTKWDPDVVFDLHTTDGTRHGYELTYMPPLTPAMDSGVLKFTQDELLPRIRKAFKKKFNQELFDYGNAVHDKVGWKWESVGPESRYVTNYAGYRNRISILSEATTYIPFEARVVATDRFVWEILTDLYARAGQVRKIIDYADAELSTWTQNPAKLPQLGVRFESLAGRTEEAILEPERKPGEAVPFGRPKNLIRIKMPVFDRYKTTRTATVPQAYLVPSVLKDLIPLIKLHGIDVYEVTAATTAPGEIFAVSQVNRAAQAFQNFHLTSLEGKFSPENINISSGDFIVPTNQKTGMLIFNLLEPESMDGLTAWEFLKDSISVDAVYPIRKIFNTRGLKTERVP